MASPEAIPLVKDWRIHEDGTSSDHRILETLLDFGKRSTIPQFRKDDTTCEKPTGRHFGELSRREHRH